MSLQSGILYSSLLLTYPSLDSGLTYTHPSCQGRSQEFVSEGDKRVGSVTSGVQSPGWSLGQSPQKPENYAEILIECQKFHTVQRKKFLPWQFRRGVFLVPPFPTPLQVVSTCSFSETGSIGELPRCTAWTCICCWPCLKELGRHMSKCLKFCTGIEI